MPITQMPEPLNAPHESVTQEIEVRRSRFICYLRPVLTKDEATQSLQEIKNEHWQAAHHCYAYRLGASGMEYRMSDDGEPSGSAGKPILFAMQKADLTNALLVVVRYFGGVKLGIGPLARAYGESASTGIKAAHLRPLIPMETLLVHCMYDDVSRIIHLLEEVEAEYIQEFADAVSFEVTLPSSKVEFLTEQVIERTSARAGFSKISTE